MDILDGRLYKSRGGAGERDCGRLQLKGLQKLRAR